MQAFARPSGSMVGTVTLFLCTPGGASDAAPGAPLGAGEVVWGKGSAPTQGIRAELRCWCSCCLLLFDVPLDEATLVEVCDLADSAEEAGCAFCCLSDPKVVAKPGLLTQEEVEHLLSLAAGAAQPTHCGAGGPFESGTRSIRVLQAEETPTVEGIERKLVALCGLACEHLARLRVVRTATRLGLCNRGSGHTSVYVCLQERDDVWFPKLGVRFAMRRGDALFWTNHRRVDGRLCEDVRTQRIHVAAGGGLERISAVGLDAFFHDNPVRAQQRQRKFVADGAL
ncbi:unnamed protein product [Prorocentrum cordatum]|uniref:Uncharacterized protein n=1 Tax=Prorocentrum cordatum TaxID=2364126 RepID=A0ABN9QJY8_9DINO|nr:unnamed protein product [Polarella glacialis]